MWSLSRKRWPSVLPREMMTASARSTLVPLMPSCLYPSGCFSSLLEGDPRAELQLARPAVACRCGAKSGCPAVATGACGVPKLLTASLPKFLLRRARRVEQLAMRSSRLDLPKRNALTSRRSRSKNEGCRKALRPETRPSMIARSLTSLPSFWVSKPITAV